jgi:hypothetical protein
MADRGSESVTTLIIIAFAHVINGSTIEEGFERFQGIARKTLDYDAFRNAVGACLREGLIYEPIRLPEGALQCHWRLELTPKGVEAAHKQVAST